MEKGSKLNSAAGPQGMLQVDTAFFQRCCEIGRRHRGLRTADAGCSALRFGALTSGRESFKAFSMRFHL